MELKIILQLALALVLGGLVGWERWRDHKEAGVRTHALVTFGATLFSLVSIFGLEKFSQTATDVSRIMSNIVTGIGFLGAGMIVLRDGRVRGLTTAAGLWVCAGIGMAIAVEWYMVSIFSALIVVLTFQIMGRLFPNSNTH
jgi:putative Mg2+ transporter-C (MgtC) family protein